MPDSRIVDGDCRTVLAGLPERSVHCVVTSPPYFGLRSYAGLEPSTWANGWHGCLGMEPTPEQFAANIVEVFRAVWRVLRDDGTCWVNLGDGYAHSGACGGGSPDGPRTPRKLDRDVQRITHNRIPPGLEPKDLVGIPWRCAFALQADGWFLRSAMPWVKRSAMPESVAGSSWERHRVRNAEKELVECPGCATCDPNDGLALGMSAGRPSSAVEYVFLLTKQGTYFFDAEGVRQRQSDLTLSRFVNAPRKTETKGAPPGQCRGNQTFKTEIGNVGGRNLRNSDLWFESIKAPHGMVMVGDEPVGLDITSEALKLKHFAAFPTRFVATCLKAGTSHKGVCPKCGAPWVRVLSKERVKTRPGAETKVAIASGGVLFKDSDKKARFDLDSDIVGNRDPYRHVTESRTVGWRASCQCDAGEPVPATVCDPFTGSGTTGVVCRRMGLAFIGCEASPEYAEMARRRIANPDPEPEAPQVAGQGELWE
ncbi:MAG: DNA methyltransferase [Candidatus Nanopelagicales bacterium]|nr:DNA methyltransferase [Candidatus Nanopelagicales bacterium]